MTPKEPQGSKPQDPKKSTGKKAPVSPRTRAAATPDRFTVLSFAEYRERRRRIVMCTAYDAPQARAAAAAGIDVVLVGDSIGTTSFGQPNTLGVTIDDMVRATRSVTTAAPELFVVGDMPFMSWQADHSEGMRNAARLITQGGAQMVKVEGASADTLRLVSDLDDAGIPVMGHVGLTPQSVHAFGGYRAQGKEVDGIVDLLTDVQQLLQAGVSALVLECIPAEVARQITQMSPVATIGIGAGPDCNGEVQVFHDLVGLGGDFRPRHARRYVDAAELITQGLRDYAADVRKHRFPAEEQTIHIDGDVLDDAMVAYVEELVGDLDEFLDDMEDDDEDDGEYDGGTYSDGPQLPHFGGPFGGSLN
ncbi:MAG: 3-methyl-2-oxobutanoate hydroxymethyltransferase [Actinomycetes bacterium]|jgi:3-methyl-2-oxobutanoate hydroxymethyltransferase|nr:3-methyl-2-oxobutanoate hydroxymethyltransferase [Actinomycetes bacterium]